MASDLALEDLPAGTQADEPWEDAEPATWRYDPLAASIYHIVPRPRSGTDNDGKLQITHLRCNLLKHDQAQRLPKYVRARLSLTLDGTARALPGLAARGSPAPARHARPASWETASGCGSGTAR